MTIGFILIFLGLAAIILGVVVVSGAKTKPAVEDKKEIANTAIADTAAAPAVLSEKSKEDAFEGLIQMATADGVLTPNEVKTLKEKAVELGLEYSSFETRINEQVKAKHSEKETVVIDKNKEKGNEFEAYIASKFSKNYFKLSSWTGDKYKNGVYAENTTHPDLEVKYDDTKRQGHFAVECKFRSSYFKNGIEWCKEHQLQNYRGYAKEKGIPVFVAIGVEGTAVDPNDLFIVPLERIASVFLTKEFLEPFRKANFKEKHFYYDCYAKVLK